MDCGPTCLYMICGHYGRTVPIETLRNLTEIGKEGVNLLGLSDAAEKIGLKTFAVQLTMDELRAGFPLPAILHWGQNHFIVLYKIKRKKFFIADPGIGLLTLTEADFTQKWITAKIADIALSIEPTPDFYNKQVGYVEDEGRKKGFGSMLPYLYPYKKLFIQLCLGMLLGSLLQLVLPFLTQAIVDVGINTANIHFVYIILIAQLSLFAGRLAVDFIKAWILYHISTRINISILTDFLIKLMKLPVSYFDSKKTGDVLQRMNDHHRIQNFLTGTSLTTLFSVFNLVIFSVVLGMYSLPIFFVFMLAATLYVLWVIVFLKKRKLLDYKQFDVSAAEQGKTMELIQGMQEIKLQGCEKQKRWGWEHLKARSFKLGIKNLALNQWQQTGAFFINEGKNIVITFLAAKAVIDGNLTLGGMVAIQYIIGQLNGPIEQMIGFVQSWQLAKISLDRLNEIHGLREEERAAPSISPGGGGNGGDGSEGIFANELTSLIPTNKSIAFSNLSFKYPGAGNERVLKHIDLLIPQGKITAIVGSSGSGKTTLLKLLLKFYENYTGEIKIGEGKPNQSSLSSSQNLSSVDEGNMYQSPLSSSQHPSPLWGEGTGLRGLSHRAWRKQIGVVMQDSFIFSDSIAANIAVSDEEPSLQKLREAAHIANILEFIESLPLGFYTKIGAEGNGVSAGQRQRILIARAVYKNPSYIFLDEATNSLDANNEKVIIENLEKFFENKTVVVVAHRLSTVKHADQIVVLNSGQITEFGSHEALAKLKGDYYTLVKNQLELGS